MIHKCLSLFKMNQIFELLCFSKQKCGTKECRNFMAQLQPFLKHLCIYQQQKCGKLSPYCLGRVLSFLFFFLHLIFIVIYEFSGNTLLHIKGKFHYFSTITVFSNAPKRHLLTTVWSSFSGTQQVNKFRQCKQHGPWQNIRDKWICFHH